MKSESGWKAVYMLDPPSNVTYAGITMIEWQIRGLSYLLRSDGGGLGGPGVGMSRVEARVSPLGAGYPLPWRYVINLSGADYPVVPVETMARVLSFFPKGSNFMEVLSANK